MKPLACVLRLNCISPHSPKSKYTFTLSWKPIQMHDTEKLYFCDYRCKILYDSICKQGKFIIIILYSWIWNPDVQFACAACSIRCLSCMHKIFSSSAIPYRLALEFDWQANGAKFTYFGGRGVDVDKFIKILYYWIKILINGTLCNNLCITCRRWRTNHRNNEWRGQWSEWQSWWSCHWNDKWYPNYRCRYID